MTRCLTIQNLHLRHDLALNYEEAFERVQEVAGVFGLRARIVEQPADEVSEERGWGPFDVTGLIAGDPPVIYKDVYDRLPAWAKDGVCTHSRDDRGELIPLPEDFTHTATTAFTDLSPDPRFFSDTQSSNIAVALEVGWSFKEGEGVPIPVPSFQLIAFAKGMNIEFDTRDAMPHLSLLVRTGAKICEVSPADYAYYTTKETVMRAFGNLKNLAGIVSGN